MSSLNIIQESRAVCWSDEGAIDGVKETTEMFPRTYSQSCAGARKKICSWTYLGTRG